MMNWMAREGARLVDNGYHILPVRPGDKAPATFTLGTWREMPDWTRYCERPPSAIELDHWSAFPGCSIGIAGGTVVGIDIDLLDEALSFRVGEIAKHVLGDTPALRFGKRPKRLLVYATEKPFYSFQSGPIQILALGRQFVAYGQHPDTGMDYQWPIGALAELARDQLPVVSETMVRTFLAEAVKLLPADMRATRLPQARAGAGGAKEPATREAIAEALTFINNDRVDYQWWLQIGMSIHEALQGDGLDLWHSWSSASIEYKPADLDKKWPTFGRYGGERVGAGSIFEEARRNGWTPSPGLALLAADGQIAAVVDVDFAAICRSATVAVAVPPEPDPPPAIQPTWTVPKGVPGWRRDLAGGLRMFVDHVDETAVSPHPWLALGAALATFGCIAGRRYAGPTGLRTNLYAVGIAGSGGGKDYPLRRATALLSAAELDRMIGGSKIASGAAILTALEREPCTIFPTDEIGFVMQAVANRAKASRHEADIIGNMVELYSAAQGTFHGTAFANQKEKPKVVIHQPNLCVFGVTTPQIFWSALSSAHVADGSLARFLIFETDNPYPDPREDVLTTAVPGDLVAVAKQIAKGAEGHDPFPSGNSSLMAAHPFVCSYADDAAKARARDISAYQTQLLRENAGTARESLLARLRENAFKVALVRSIADDPLAPTISALDLDWGFDIAWNSVQTIMRAVDERVADTPGEAEVKRVLLLMRDNGAAGIPKADLTRKTQWLAGARRRNEIVTDLIEAGQVRAEQVVTGGAPKVIYYAL